MLNRHTKSGHEEQKDSAEIRTLGSQEGWYRYKKRAVSGAWWFGERAANAEGCTKRRSWLIGTYLRPTLDVPGSDVDRAVFLRDLLTFFLAWKQALLI